MTVQKFISNGYNEYASYAGSLRSSDRFRQLSEIPNPTRRLAALACDLGVYVGTKAVIKSKGVIALDGGYESEVFLDSKQGIVTKYVRGSRDMSEGEREKLRARKQYEFDAVQEYLSSLVLEQTITVGPHVMTPRFRAVQTTQPYVRYGSVIEQLTPNTPDITLSDPEGSSPELLDQISDFIDDSWHLYARHNLLPDTNGKDNIVQVDGQLTMIDTQPIGDTHADIQELIKAQLDNLGVQLSSIR